MNESERPVGVKRFLGGRPILAPTDRPWESTGTANSAAVFLDKTPANSPLIEGLLGPEGLGDRRAANGVVVVQYGGFGRLPGGTSIATGRGLAVFTPGFRLLKRWPEPILEPTPGPDSYDSAGVEDARLCRIADTFYAFYCGFNGQRGCACAAVSQDLLHWVKKGPLAGNINDIQNKDHVMFEQMAAGRYWMLHRPWGEPLEVNDFVIRLAWADDPLGPWTDAGEIIRACSALHFKDVWAGAGSVPIHLGGGRFLLIYHTGGRYPDGFRLYEACAALLDLSRYTPDDPGAVVLSRLEPLIRPETRWEKNPAPHLKIDIVFPVGSYVRDDDLVIVYGAGDRYTCAARLSFSDVVRRLENQVDRALPHGRGVPDGR